MVRTEYGEVVSPNARIDSNAYDRDLYAEARCLISLAVKRRKIVGAEDTITFDRRSRASGYATHHEIYDISEDARHVLLCIRDTEGGRYGVKTVSKRYKLLSAHGVAGVRVQVASKAKAAKAAKQAGDDVYGHAIAVCRGEKKLRLSPTATRIGYKIVASNGGGFSSVYDGSAWNIGVARRERATMNHEGGYYVFPTIESALDSWTNGNTFPDTPTDDSFSILRCECSGREYRHNNEKICVTSVKPVSEFASIIN